MEYLVFLIFGSQYGVMDDVTSTSWGAFTLQEKIIIL